MRYRLHTDPVSSFVRCNTYFAVEYHILFLNNPSSSWLMIIDIIPPGWIIWEKKSLNKSQLIAFLKKSNFLNVSYESRTEKQSKGRLPSSGFASSSQKADWDVRFSTRAGDTFQCLSRRWKEGKVIQSTIHCTQAAFDCIALQTRYFAGKHKTVYH